MDSHNATITHSSGDSTTTTSNNNNNNKDRDKDKKHLNQLNKISHKISKPTTKKQSFNHQPKLNNANFSENTQQPPVYNINKNDFRELVQKLTGSTAHDPSFSSSSTTTTLQQQQPTPLPSKPQSSRLHRIRPPPLAQITDRRPPSAPFSPLPPFPGVDSAAAVESPVTAYLRRNFLSSSSAVDSSNPKEFSGFPAPRWSGLIGSHLGQVVYSPQGIAGSSVGVMGSQPMFLFPPSPLSFGCLNSPSSLLGFSKLPLSPTVTVPSPK